MPWSETTYWENTLLVSILSFWMRLVGSSRLISIKRRGRQTPRLSLRPVANSDYPPRSNDRVPATAAMFGYFLTVGFRHVVLANSRSEEHTSELQSPCNL